MRTLAEESRQLWAPLLDYMAEGEAQFIPALFERVIQATAPTSGLSALCDKLWY